MTKGEIIDAFIFLKTLTLKKISNGFLLRLSYNLSKIWSKYIHWGQPESLSIEPTNLCNLKCPECPSGNNSMTRPRLFMPLEKYKSLIDESKNTLAYLQLFFQGEPFLHPKLFDLIHYATSHGIYTVTSTNGQFLRSENCDKIVNSGLQRIIISVDGTTQESYEKYRVGGSLDLVVSGISNLVASKKKLKSHTPFIIMQFVVFATNEHQISEVQQLAERLQVDKLELKTAQIENFEQGNPLIPKNDKFSRYALQKQGTYKLKRKKGFKCKRIWLGSVISADNALLPCCFDKNAQHAYSTLHKGSLTKAWKQSTARDFRMKVWNDSHEFDMCHNCSEGLQ